MIGSRPLPRDPERPGDPPRQFRLVLPSGVARDVPGASLVRRAVLWVIALLATLFGTGLLVTAVLTIDVTVAGRGTLEPADVWPVRSREGGIVLTVHVRTGDTVAADQALLALDPFEQRQVLAELEARWRQRRMEHDRAVAGHPTDLVRQRERVAAAAARVLEARARMRGVLVDHGIDPHVDSALLRYVPGVGVGLDLAVAGLDAANAEHRSEQTQLEALNLAALDRRREQAELESLGEQIAAQRQRLRRLVVVAPAGGVVLTENVEDLVGASVQSGAPLLELADPAAWRVVVLVPADLVHRVRVGDSVRVELSAFRREEHRRVDGTVRTISPQPAVAGEAGPSPGFPVGSAYRVDVPLDSVQVALLGAERLRRGYTAEARIITRSGNALRLLWSYLREQATR